MHDAANARTVSGTIRATTAQSFELRYPSALQEATLDQGVLNFSLNMPPQNPDSYVPPSWEKVTKVDPFQNFWFKERGALADSAHLIVRMAPEDEITLNVQTNGELVAPEFVHAGAQDRQLTLDNLQVRAETLVGDPAVFDPSTLPREFGVYIWYVPPIATVDDQELSPELREALKDLGY